MGAPIALWRKLGPFVVPDTMTPIHDQRNHSFRIQLSQGEASLDYEVLGREMHIHHTFVPESLRGRGIAEILVRNALSWAAEAQLSVVAECSYVAQFLDRHPELRSNPGRPGGANR